MGISLAVLGLFGASAAAQIPGLPIPNVPIAPPSIPAAPLPPIIRQPASLPPGAPLPRLIPADAPPAGTVPGTVMTFQKPAGGGVVAQPVSIVQTPKPADKSAEKVPLPMPKSAAMPIPSEKAFRLEDDKTLETRIIRELTEASKARALQDDKTKLPTEEKFTLPVYQPVAAAGTPLPPRAFAPTQLLLEPSYVVHRRLLFEELNAERHGWDFGIAQPLISTAQFYGDVLLWPARLASNLDERYDTSAGKCPPGSPVPYFLYPKEITPFGALVGFTVIGGTLAIFP